MARWQGSIEVEEIARWMQKSPTFVRKSIENGSLPIGSYNKNGNRGSYYISPKRAYEYIGYIREEDLRDEENINDSIAADNCYVTAMQGK